MINPKTTKTSDHTSVPDVLFELMQAKFDKSNDGNKELTNKSNIKSIIGKFVLKVKKILHDGGSDDKYKTSTSIDDLKFEDILPRRIASYANSKQY